MSRPGVSLSSKRLDRRRPIVFLPAGPVGWPTHQPIFHALEQVWQSLDWDIQRLWYPRPTWNDFEQLNGRPFLVFPLGIAHYDSLWFLEQARKRGIRSPAAIMVNADFLKGLVPLFLYRSIFLKDDIFVVSCHREAQILQEVFQGTANVAIIPYPIDTSYFVPSKNEGESSVKKIMYAGRITPQKNLTVLIRAFGQFLRQYGAAELLIAGGPDEIGYPHISKAVPQERYIHTVAKTVVEEGLEAHVKFVGNLGAEPLLRHIQESHLFVTLSTHTGEDFGYAAAQALSCGVPTLLSDWGGACEFPGLKVRMDMDAEGRALQVADGATLLHEAIHQDRAMARAWALEKFSLKAVANEWKALGNFGDVQPQMSLEYCQKFFDYINSPGTPFFDNANDKIFQKLVGIYSGEWEVSDVHPLRGQVGCDHQAF